MKEKPTISGVFMTLHDEAIEALAKSLGATCTCSQDKDSVEKCKVHKLIEKKRKDATITGR